MSLSLTNRHVSYVFLITFLVLFFLLTLFALTKPISQDEGVFLAIGKNVAHDYLPYQDFFDHKPPGIYYLFSLIFKIFGQHLLIAKALLLLVELATAILIFKISHLVKPGSGPVAATIFIFLLIFFEGNYTIAEPFMAFFLVSSYYLVLNKSNHSGNYFSAGLCAACAILFKQTGIISLLPLILLLLFRGSIKSILLAMIGFFMPLFLLFIFLWKNDIYHAGFEQIIMLNFTAYPSENIGIVLRGLRSQFLWTLPVWILFFYGVRKVNQKWVAALVILPIPVMIFRHYPHYWIQIIPFVAIISGASVAGAKKWLGISLAIMLFTLSSIRVFRDAPWNFQLLKEQYEASHYIDTLDSPVISAENQFTGFYFLSDKQPLNKFLYITEINNDVLNAEAGTIDDLNETSDVIVLWPKDTNYAYARKLQDYILENYKPIREYEKLGLVVYRK